MFATVRRCMSIRFPLSRPELPADQLPEIISSTVLPRIIKSYIARHVRDTRRGKPTTVAAAPLITASDTGSTSNVDILAIPNPFLRHKYERDVDKVYPDEEPVYGVMTQFPPRIQKKMLARYPRHTLPPSINNPLAAPPRIIWEDPSSPVPLNTLITWAGEWRPSDEPKGLFSGRRKMFKGHKRERARAEIRAETAFRMGNMDQRVQQWREDKKTARLSKRPSLPF